jgi:hypothetical protein
MSSSILCRSMVRPFCAFWGWSHFNARSQELFPAAGQSRHFGRETGLTASPQKAGLPAAGQVRRVRAMNRLMHRKR